MSLSAAKTLKTGQENTRRPRLSGNFSLPVAVHSVIGGVKLGATSDINGESEPCDIYFSLSYNSLRRKDVLRCNNPRLSGNAPCDTHRQSQSAGRAGQHNQFQLRQDWSWQFWAVERGLPFLGSAPSLPLEMAPSLWTDTASNDVTSMTTVTNSIQPFFIKISWITKFCGHC